MSRYYEKQWQVFNKQCRVFNKNFSDDIVDAIVPLPEPEPVKEDNMYTRRRRRNKYHSIYTHYDRCQAAVTYRSMLEE